MEFPPKRILRRGFGASDLFIQEVIPSLEREGGFRQGRGRAR